MKAKMFLDELKTPSIDTKWKYKLFVDFKRKSTSCFIDPKSNKNMKEIRL